MPMILLLLAARAAWSQDAPAPALPAPPAPQAATSAERAEAAYLAALTAWKDHRYEVALEGSRKALLLDPGLGPARLLEAYALVKVGDIEEGVARLRILGMEEGDTAESDEIVRRAQSLSTRITDRWRRDQVSLSIGQQINWETSYVGSTGVLGPTFDVGVPLGAHTGVRLESATDWLPADGSLDVGGQSLAGLATLSLPVRRGVWSFDVGVGPTLWFAVGGYWPDEHQVYLGARGALGVDARVSRRFGLRFEGGTRWLPAVHDTLPWYSQPLDTRVACVWWLGK